MTPLITCPQCQTRLTDGVFNHAGLSPCPACGTGLQVEVFPALFRKIVPGQAAQPVMVEGESGCFFHPQKKAIIPCSSCGRFLCALCDCEFGGEHFCPSCLETGKSKGKIQKLENERIRYDNIALTLTIAPILIFYFTIITAPMALFIIIRYWNKPRSLVQSSRARFMVAGVLALLEIAGWATLIIVLATKH